MIKEFPEWGQPNRVEDVLGIRKKKISKPKRKRRMRKEISPTRNVGCPDRLATKEILQR